MFRRELVEVMSVLKKIITVVIFVMLLIVNVCSAADSDTGNLLYENFELETMNFHAASDEGESVVLMDEISQNSAIMFKTPKGESSFYKSLRKTSESFTIGFKLRFSEGEPILRVNVLSAASKPIKTIDINSKGVESKDGSVSIASGEWAHIRMFFNYEEMRFLVKVNTEEIGYYEIPQELAKGISGLKLTSASDSPSIVELDDIYCYTGLEERSDYEILPDNQRVLHRLEKGVAVFENRSKAVINGRQKAAGEAFSLELDDCRLVALRAAIEAYGAEVLWNGAQNAIVVKYADKEISFFDKKNTVEVDGEIVIMAGECRIIGSVTYVPADCFSQIFGKRVYKEPTGLTIISDTDIFTKSSQEDVRLLGTLVKNLSGLDYIERADGGYLFIPDSLEQTFMAQIPVQMISADYNQEGNTPQNAIDENLDTRWSSDIDGTELTLDLGEEKRVSAVYIAWMNAIDRKSYFEILASKDGINYEEVIARTESTKKTNAHEVYLINGNYRYIRYKGYGNSANTWNSITEIGVMEKVVQHE